MIEISSVFSCKVLYCLLLQRFNLLMRFKVISLRLLIGYLVYANMLFFSLSQQSGFRFLVQSSHTIVR
jgi:hypothetical protein